MKGTLLLLALLVTGELGFQTTEACAPFFNVFTAMAIGNKELMNAVLSYYDPTAQEREAFEKIQECYNEAGLRGKFLDAKVLEAILFSPQCMGYYTEDIMDKIKSFLSKLTFM
ncbi:androgen-binding protein homolog [Peromyscus californicus insignis]|uniref:androgen-binding protein homolog n=1 Tax=Peromyscus californicus insignis TaxID=564181 RepID=UPI0022A79EBB|nr:androgen-binding protein homolog [Peromyscus californicus insignis]